MEKKEVTFVDDAIKDLTDITNQIDGIIYLMGGYVARLAPSRDGLRACFANIQHQITETVVFLAGAQSSEAEKLDEGSGDEPSGDELSDDEKVDINNITEELNNLQEQLNRVNKLIVDHQREGLGSGFGDIQDQISKMIVFLESERRLEQDFCCDLWGCPT